MVDAVLGAEDLDGAADVYGIDAVELHGAHGLVGGERQHRQARLVALDDAPRRDHLADVQPGTLLGAQLAERRVGDARHRRQHDRGRDLEVAEPQGARQRGGGHTIHCPRPRWR